MNLSVFSLSSISQLPCTRIRPLPCTLLRSWHAPSRHQRRQEERLRVKLYICGRSSVEPQTRKPLASWDCYPRSGCLHSLFHHERLGGVGFPTAAGIDTCFEGELFYVHVFLRSFLFFHESSLSLLSLECCSHAHCCCTSFFIGIWFFSQCHGLGLLPVMSVVTV